MKVFIYVLTEPDGETIRYVGKSNENRFHKRLIEHCRYSQMKYKTHKHNWIKSLLAIGQKPCIKIIEECQEDTYREREKYWIQYYRNQGCQLTNSTEGGEGAIRIPNRQITDEQKLKISNTLKQRHMDIPNEMLLNCSNAGKKSRGIKRNFKFEQTSKEIGISFSYKNRRGIVCKWRAYVNLNGKHIHIGLYDTEQEAIEARRKYLSNHNLK